MMRALRLLAGTFALATSVFVVDASGAELKVLSAGASALSSSPSALNQTDSTGQRSSLARTASADLVQRKGLGLALCSAR